MTKLLVCIDESNSKKLLPFLESFPTSTEIILFHVHKLANGLLDFNINDMLERMNEKYINQSKELLQQVGHELKSLGFHNVKAFSAGGDPRKMIEERIKEETVDLVVMGRRGLGVLGSMLMGSVSNHITHIAGVSVAIVP